MEFTVILHHKGNAIAKKEFYQQNDRSQECILSFLNLLRSEKISFSYGKIQLNYSER